MQQSVGNRDNSVAFSLNELKELEQRRLADERTKRTATIAAAEQARIDAEDAAARRIEEVARADREARFRIEAARLEAARQERIAVQTAEAAARVQHEAELAQQRLVEELAIKKIEAHKKRPRWMIAVTALAVVASAILVGFTVQAVAASKDSKAAATIAQIERDQAIQAQKDADAKILAITDELAKLDVAVNDAVDRVAKATSIAEAKKAAADADALRAREAKLRRDADAAQVEREHQLRIHPINVAPECINNSLDKKCLK